MVGRVKASMSVAMFVACAWTLNGFAQTPVTQPGPPPPHVEHGADFDSERKQANDLFLAHRPLDALPLYEDLCRQDNTIAVFAERHAAGLFAKAPTLADPAEAKKTQEEGWAELNRAKALGDNSAYVQSLLDEHYKTNPITVALRGIPLTPGYTYQGNAEAQALLKQAEVYFSQRQLDKAAELYTAAATKDPNYYDAALYAGDTYFNMQQMPTAGVWFAKAIAIDPDRDTAYRYWGDALHKSGDMASAKSKFEAAYVAEPYNKPGWLSLQQWGKETQVPVAPPRINRPKYTTLYGKLVDDPAMQNEIGDGHTAWLAYEKARVAHGGLAQYQWIVTGSTSITGVLTPNGYRHSLEEEVDSLNATADAVKTMLENGTIAEEKLEPSLQLLLKLQRDGMIACWVLLNGYDAGTLQDYAPYRKTHRELLLAYVDKYVVGAKQ